MESLRAVVEQAVATFQSADTPPQLRALCVELLGRACATDDDNRKSLVAETEGVLAVLAAALEEVASSVSAARVAATAAWHLCIGHPANKAHVGGTLLPAVVSLLLHECEDEDTAVPCAMALWSFCYGLAANQRRALELGAVPALARMMADEVVERRPACLHAATGALWHISALPEARPAIASARGVVAAVVEAVSAADEETATLCCLLLGNLALVDDVSALQNAGAFQCVRAFVRSKDVSTFRLHNLCWTTLEPVRMLIASKVSSVRELGLFISGVLSRDRNESAKMFIDGIVTEVETFLRHAPEDASVEEQRLASFVLTNLGVAIPVPPRLQADCRSADFGAWLDSLGLSRYLDVLRENDVDSVERLGLLSEDDLKTLGLQLGARRQIQAVARAISSSAASTPDPSQARHCLVCMEKLREVCFVPCGHVVACRECAQILSARRDNCPICRSQVQTTVFPRFV